MDEEEMESCWEKIWESEKSSSDEGEDVESLILLSCNENQRVHLCMARGCVTQRGRPLISRRERRLPDTHSHTYTHTGFSQGVCFNR